MQTCTKTAPKPSFQSGVVSTLYTNGYPDSDVSEHKSRTKTRTKPRYTYLKCTKTAHNFLSGGFDVWH